MDLVLRLSNGGELFQGCKNDAKAAIGASVDPTSSFLAPYRVDYLVLAAEEKQPPVGAQRGIRIMLKDRLFPDAANRVAVTTAATSAARDCARRLRSGKRVLSTCNAGANRSGLISGLTLRFLGLSGLDAVERVKRARGAAALSNIDFAEVVRTAAIAPLRGQCDSCGREFVRRCGCGARLTPKPGWSCTADPNHAQMITDLLACRCGLVPAR